jgi:MFS family permease
MSAEQVIRAGGSPVEVLRNRRFLALWLAQVVTQVGANMVLFGLTVQVYVLSGRSNTSVSLLILSFLVPAVIFGAVAGVYVDRLDRRLILVSTNLLRAAAFVGLFLVQDNLTLIFLLIIVISTLTTFFGPAEAAMIPVIVGRNQLLAANSFYVFTLQASFFLGFALLGPLVVNLAGQHLLLWLAAGLFAIGAALCAILPSHNPRLSVTGHHPAQALGEAGSAVATTFSQLLDGLRFIVANTKVFWPLAYLALTASLIGVLGVLGPGFATEALGLTERDFVVVVLPIGVGLVMGMLALNQYGRLFSRRRGIEGGMIVLGLSLLALSIAQPLSRAFALPSLLSVVIVIAVATGAAYAMVAVPAQTQLQEELPPGIRGRVFGVLNMLISIASFLPIIVVGPIADVVGTSVVVQGAAVFVLLAAAGSIWKAHPTIETLGPSGLLDAVDPVSITGRSLTQPIQLDYVDEPPPPTAVATEIASPVIPGQPGPAEPPDGDQARR